MEKEREKEKDRGAMSLDELRPLKSVSNPQFFTGLKLNTAAPPSSHYLALQQQISHYQRENAELTARLARMASAFPNNGREGQPTISPRLTLDANGNNNPSYPSQYPNTVTQQTELQREMLRRSQEISSLKAQCTRQTEALKMAQTEMRDLRDRTVDEKQKLVNELEGEKRRASKDREELAKTIEENRKIKLQIDQMASELTLANNKTSKLSQDFLVEKASNDENQNAISQLRNELSESRKLLKNRNEMIEKMRTERSEQLRRLGDESARRLSQLVQDETNAQEKASEAEHQLELMRSKFEDLETEKRTEILGLKARMVTLEKTKLRLESKISSLMSNRPKCRKSSSMLSGSSSFSESTESSSGTDSYDGSSVETSHVTGQSSDKGEEGETGKVPSASISKLRTNNRRTSHRSLHKIIKRQESEILSLNRALENHKEEASLDSVALSRRHAAAMTAQQRLNDSLCSQNKQLLDETRELHAQLASLKNQLNRQTIEAEKDQIEQRTKAEGAEGRARESERRERILKMEKEERERELEKEIECLKARNQELEKKENGRKEYVAQLEYTASTAEEHAKLAQGIVMNKIGVTKRETAEKIQKIEAEMTQELEKLNKLKIEAEAKVVRLENELYALQHKIQEQEAIVEGLKADQRELVQLRNSHQFLKMETDTQIDALKKEAASLVSQNQTLTRQLEDERAEARRTLNETESRLTSNRVEVERELMLREANDAKEACEEAEKKLQATESHHHELLKKYEQLQESVETKIQLAVEQSSLDTERRLSEMREENVRLEARVSQFSEQAATRSKKLQQAEDELKVATDKVRSLQLEMTKVRTEAESHKAETNELLETLKGSLSKAKTESSKRLERLKSKLEMRKMKVSSMRKQIESLEEQRNREIKRLRDELDKMTEAKQLVEADNNVLQLEAKTDKEMYEKNLHKLELEKQTAEQETELVKSRLDSIQAKLASRDEASRQVSMSSLSALGRQGREIFDEADVSGTDRPRVIGSYVDASGANTNANTFHSSEIDDLQMRAEKRIASLNSQLTLLNSSLESERDKVRRLETELADANNSRQAANNEAAKLKTSLEEAKTSANTLKTELGECRKALESSIFSQQEKDERLESEWMGKINCLNAEIESLTLKNSVIEDKTLTLEEENKKSITRAIAAERKVRELELKVEDLQSSIASLEGATQELGKEANKVGELEKQVKAKEKEIETLGKEIAALQNRQTHQLEESEGRLRQLGEELAQGKEQLTQQVKEHKEQEAVLRAQIECLTQTSGNLEIKLKATNEMITKLSMTNKELSVKLLRKINKYNTSKLENNKLNILLSKTSKSVGAGQMTLGFAPISSIRPSSQGVIGGSGADESMRQQDEQNSERVEMEYELLRAENDETLRNFTKMIKAYEGRIEELYNLVTIPSRISEGEYDKKMLVSELESLELKVKGLESQLEFRSSENEGLKKLVESLNNSIARIQRENEENINRAILEAHKDNETTLAELSLKVQSEVQLYRNEISVLRSQLLEYQANELYE